MIRCTYQDLLEQRDYDDLEFIADYEKVSLDEAIAIAIRDKVRQIMLTAPRGVELCDGAE